MKTYTSPYSATPRPLRRFDRRIVEHYQIPVALTALLGNWPGAEADAAYAMDSYDLERDDSAFFNSDFGADFQDDDDEAPTAEELAQEEQLKRDRLISKLEQIAVDHFLLNAPRQLLDGMLYCPQVSSFALHSGTVSVDVTWAAERWNELHPSERKLCPHCDLF